MWHRMVLVISSGKTAGNKKMVILTFFGIKSYPIQFGFKPSQTIYLVVFGNFRLVFMKDPIGLKCEAFKDFRKALHILAIIFLYALKDFSDIQAPPSPCSLIEINQLRFIFSKMS